jgi:hypothetical protein
MQVLFSRLSQVHPTKPSVCQDKFDRSILFSIGCRLAISDGTFTKDVLSSTSAIVDPHDELYDVDTLIDSLDYEQLYMNDSNEQTMPLSTSESSFIRTRRENALLNRQHYISIDKPCLLLSTNTDNDETCQTSAMVETTLGERLQKAADIYRVTGNLPFDDDYIRLVRYLIDNSSLTHLERLHLKSFFVEN